MEGTTLARKLTGADAVRFAVATRADDAAIRLLLRSNPMKGSVNLTFEREADYFRGSDLAGGKDQTIVAFSGSQLYSLFRVGNFEAQAPPRFALSAERSGALPWPLHGQLP